MLVLQHERFDSMKNYPFIKQFKLIFRQKCPQINEKDRFVDHHISRQINEVYEIVKERSILKNVQAKAERFEVSAYIPFYLK